MYMNVYQNDASYYNACDIEKIMKKTRILISFSPHMTHTPLDVDNSGFVCHLYKQIQDHSAFIMYIEMNHIFE